MDLPCGGFGNPCPPCGGFGNPCPPCGGFGNPCPENQSRQPIMPVIKQPSLYISQALVGGGAALRKLERDLRNPLALAPGFEINIEPTIGPNSSLGGGGSNHAVKGRIVGVPCGGFGNPCPPGQPKQPVMLPTKQPSLDIGQALIKKSEANTLPGGSFDNYAIKGVKMVPCGEFGNPCPPCGEFGNPCPSGQPKQPLTPPAKEPSFDIGQALINGIDLLGGQFLGVGKAQQAQRTAEQRAKQAKAANSQLQIFLMVAAGLLGLAIVFGGHGGKSSGGVLKGFKNLNIRR